MAITRRLFLTGAAAFLAFRPKPPKTSAYSNVYSNTY